ncbi:MAG: hypothetical protein J7M13_07240 [Synergistetes bacterium]|nr:hypothetical protein [Synergistota bacterium]
MLSFLLGAGGGILTVLSFPPFNYNYLIWFFPIPFYYLWDKGRSITLALLGWGCIFFGYELHFFPKNTFISLLVASIIQFLLLGLLLDKLSKGGISPPFILLLPTLWTALELAEDNGFMGISFHGFKFFSAPWLSLGIALSYHPVSFIASLLGVWGLSFLILFTGGLLYRFFRLKKIVLFSLLLSLLLSSSFFPKAVYQKASDIKVGLIQPCVSGESRKLPTAGVSRNIRLSALLFFQKNLDLIVWPVSYTEGETFPPDSIARYMSTFAREYHCYLAVGVNTINRKMVFYSLNGDILGEFHKEYLLPFMEWFPHKRGMSHTFGERSRIMKAERFSFGALLGTEVGHANLSRNLLKDGAGFILVISDDPSVEILLANATLRAIETGSYFVFSDNFGPSSLISPNGGKREIPPGVSSMLFGGISSSSKGTLFLLIGPYWIFLMLLLLSIDYLLKLRYSRSNSS